MLFLNHHAEEIRELRFTGTFSAQQLLKQTAQVQEILKAQ